MTAFVTGGTGFIGRHLVKALLSSGERVICLVREPARAPWTGDVPGLQVVQGTILDGATLEEPVAASDVIYHLAACTSAVTPAAYQEVNARGTEVLARAAAASTARIVYLSSLSAAGPRSACNPAVEDQDPAPVSAYGRSKLLGEEHLRLLLPESRWTIIRAPVVYGPGDRDVLLLFRLAALGIILQVAGTRTEVSLIHVDDMVRALLLAGREEAAVGQTYYVSDGRVYSRDEVARCLRMTVGRGRAFPVPPPFMRAAGLLADLAGRLTGRAAVLNSDRVKESLQPGWVCHSGKIEKELGFRPFIGMEEGFPATWEWYRSQGWVQARRRPSPLPPTTGKD